MTHSIITVSGLNKSVKQLLESGIGSVWVEGEISNMARPSSGHLYFSLKDAGAQVKCAMFKSALKGDSLRWQNGVQVLAHARVSLYEPRGDFQLVVDKLEESGLGALQSAFEALKQQLTQEGLFATDHKKTLPTFAQTIGVVTSPSGAALQDILHVIERRYPLAHVIIYPTLVQGKEAAPNIVQAIRAAQEHGQADVLILARGGGSLEDLWPFNEEIVARAIYACTIPTLSAVGHETDFTIADFVADVRAPTPSAAAELATPDGAALLAQVKQLQSQYARVIKHILFKAEQRLALLVKSLIHPGQQLERYAQFCDELQARMNRVMIQQLALRSAKLQTKTQILQQFHPKHRMNEYMLRVEHISERLQKSMNEKLNRYQQRFGSLIRALDALSPLAILQRGYSITYTADQRVLHSVDDLLIGDTVHTQLSHGRIIATVTAKENP